jgi:hypothetical protein
MKPLVTPRLFLLALVGLASTGLGNDVTDMQAEAERAYIRGDLAAAKEKFELIRRLEPNNRTAVAYLRRIVADEAQRNAGKAPPNTTQAALTKLILEKVDFREATLVDVLDFLKQKGNQLGGGKLAINFVFQLDEAARNAKVTVTLNNAPYSEVLRYIGELANVQFVYEPYAIVVKPKSAAQPTPGNEVAKEPQTGIKIPGF